MYHISATFVAIDIVDENRVLVDCNKISPNTLIERMGDHEIGIGNCSYGAGVMSLR